MPSDDAASPARSDGHLFRYPLVDALRDRRSRRFARGMRLNGGPLAYDSAVEPAAPTAEEEAALAFAGCGVTGPALADLPYETGEEVEAGGGNIMTHFVGRTVASGDAMHAVTLFVLNDEGAWMLRRPQDFPRTELPGLIRLSREGRLLELYERSRVRLADGRPQVPREIPVTLAFNKWSANRPGTLYFLPVAELTAYYINILLTAFEPDFGYFILDERNRYRPAGVGGFARSKGGHLHDDPDEGRVATVGVLETWLCEFAAIEHGGMLQNLALMTQALGLGGFPHFAAHPSAWFEALGFRMEDVPLSRVAGAGPVAARLLRALGRDRPVPTAVGLERDGTPLIRPYCPPHHASMEEAVLAFVDYKHADGSGTFRDGGGVTGWRDGAGVQAGMPRYSDESIAATIAYCEYVHGRYGRFPAVGGPFRTVLAHQAHRVDPDFYRAFYRPEALSRTQRAREGA